MNSIQEVGTHVLAIMKNSIFLTYLIASQINTFSAAAAMNTVYTMSGAATSSMEDITAVVPQDALRFFQVYTFGISQNRDIVLWMIEKAKRNGFKAIVLTVDLPVIGERYSSPITDLSHLR